ncbi:Beta-galactosidase C-terminal domain [Nonomuraea sp. GTA35]|uniref:Beta-galactosidase C-terminal domain n=1 Tax=Nonomuraea sp. GTA35 TaxID=1676746 RepID=UPI0035C17873
MEHSTSAAPRRHPARTRPAVPRRHPARTRPAAPAWTRNEHGRGAAHYVTTLPTGPALARVLSAVCAEAGVPTVSTGGVELVRRSHPDGRSFLFAVNHSYAGAVVEAKGTTLDGAPVDGSLTVPAGAVRIVREAR